MTDTHPKIMVSGTGPAGLLAALALARAGHAVTLIGPAPKPSDRRTTALMKPALDMLDRLGLLDAVAAEAAPLRTMRIADATKRLIRSPVVTFRASEIGEELFGLNVPNMALVPAIADAVRGESAITLHEALVAEWEIGPDWIDALLDDGTRIRAKLAVAADGRLSPAREAAGITTCIHAYGQSALVVNFAHTRDHASTSTEFHTEAGPFTQVPLPGRRSSLVWVADQATAEELNALDDAELSMRVERQMQSMLGRVTVEPGRQVYPLSAALPRQFARNRVALIGEAAHVFPPIGAQGLNLGIRDVETIVEIAGAHPDDPGAPDATASYDRRRRLDVMARSGAVNLLHRSLLSDMLPAQLARSAGLGLLRNAAPLRALFMREGLRPGSSFPALFRPSRKQVGR